VLAEADKADHLLLPTVQQFAMLMSDEIKNLRIPAAAKHLRFIFAGYRYEQSTAMPVLIQVTNVADSTGAVQTVAGEKFLIWTARDPLLIGSFGFGTTAGVAPADRAKLKELLLQDRPGEALVDKAVDTIRNAADSPRSRNAVGKQCMSIVVPLQGGVLAAYHSADPKNKLYQPSVVMSTPNASFTIQGGSIEQLFGVAPHADRLRNMWRNSLLSSQLTIFVAPRQSRAPARKLRTVALGRRRAKK
jgi:hypothetical protein